MRRHWWIGGLLALSSVLATVWIASSMARYQVVPTLNGAVLIDHWRQTVQACSVSTAYQLTVSCGEPSLLNFREAGEAARAALGRLGQ